MFTVDNKFEIGEEAYTVHRKLVNYKCPVCEGKGTFEHNGFEIWCKNCNGTGKLHNAKQYILEVCKVKVRRIKVSIFESVKTIKYTVAPVDPPKIGVKNRIENNMFKTKEEAEKYCVDVENGKVVPEI